MSLYRTVLLTLALFLCGPAMARPFTAKDLATMERVSDPRLSPDGRFIAYNLRTVDWEGNKASNAIQLIDRQTPEAKPLTLVEGESAPTSPRWSRDGKWLYFLSSRSGSQQVWRLARDGSNRTQMTALPLDISGFQLTPDERSLIALIDARPECPTLACTKEKLEQEESKRIGSGIHVKSTAGIATRPWVATGSELFTGLFNVSLAGPGAPTEAIPLLKDFRAYIIGGSNVAVSSDGRTVYFTSFQPKPYLVEVDTAQLYSVPADGSAKPRRLSSVDTTYHSLIALSPDRRNLAAIEWVNWEGGYPSISLTIRNTFTGHVRKVPLVLDDRIYAMSWSSDGKSLLVTSSDKGEIPLRSIDVATGHIRTIQAIGQVTDFDSAAGAAAFVLGSLSSPHQIYDVGPSGSPRQLTHVGANVLTEAPMAPAEQFSFSGWNNEKVYGWVMKPQNFVEGRKYPVAFLIHGGPTGTFDNSWGNRWNLQLWASMGYAVVTVDFHGSSGYGEAFSNAVKGHWGDRPLEDLQKGWAYALSRYPFLDGSRACALGASYGGYMIDWIASQWNSPWKCLVSHAGMFDLRSTAYTDDLSGYFQTQHAGLEPFTPQGAEHFNPSSHIDQWKVPILVIHGGVDYRVPTDQGVAAYRAADSRRIPAEFLYFPDEGHGIGKPRNLVQWYGAVEEWMRRWTNQ